MTRVLIVDDSFAVRALWCTLLRRIGGVEIVDDCATVRAALASMRRVVPDIVLLDLQLADGSGMEVMQVARREFPAVKFVMVSNYADKLVRDACKAAGASAFFDKSHDISALSQFLRELVE